VSAVCHGPCGLVGAKAPDGKPLVSGKHVTGFSDTEEAAVGKTQVFCPLHGTILCVH
jgi:putative intracellular protease/amidase